MFPLFFMNTVVLLSIAYWPPLQPARGLSGSPQEQSPLIQLPPWALMDSGPKTDRYERKRRDLPSLHDNISHFFVISHCSCFMLSFHYSDGPNQCSTSSSHELCRIPATRIVCLRNRQRRDPSRQIPFNSKIQRYPTLPRILRMVEFPGYQECCTRQNRL